MEAAQLGKTVLVIDDNDLNLKLVRDLLKIDHHHVLEAGTAEFGLELARRYKPDLILMDIELPGMDGLTATRIIRAEESIKAIPIIAISAYAMEDDQKMAVNAGCDGYITKPMDIRHFQKTIATHLCVDPACATPGGVDQPMDKKPIMPYGQRLLIVDDDVLNVKLLAARLATKGYKVITADNGQAALQMIHQCQPDLILLDVMMPGLDGFEVTAILKNDIQTKTIPIILITALSGEEEKRKGLEAGADEFINKPINNAELEARIVSLLKLKRYQEQLGTRKISENLMVLGMADSPVELSPEEPMPTILLVADDANSITLLTRYLAFLPCTVLLANNGEEALKIAAHKKIDIMLLDLMLPTMGGFEVCQAIKGDDATYPIQVIMITSLTDNNSKLRGIEAGTDDFLTKPINRDEFCARIKSLVRKKAYLDQLLVKVGAALNAAITDKLTGVYNQGYFKHFLSMEVKRSQRHNHHLALLMIDIDNFKNINDRYGHPIGDQFLKKVADILKNNIREVDLVARYGGEEFAVSLPYADLPSAELTAARLLNAVNEQSEIACKPGVRLTVSIGIAIFPNDCDSAQALIQSADEALYAAKQGGKNRCCIHRDCAASHPTHKQGFSK